METLTNELAHNIGKDLRVKDVARLRLASKEIRDGVGKEMMKGAVADRVIEKMMPERLSARRPFPFLYLHRYQNLMAPGANEVHVPGNSNAMFPGPYGPRETLRLDRKTMRYLAAASFDEAADESSVMGGPAALAANNPAVANAPAGSWVEPPGSALDRNYGYATADGQPLFPQPELYGDVEEPDSDELRHTWVPGWRPAWPDPVEVSTGADGASIEYDMPTRTSQLVNQRDTATGAPGSLVPTGVAPVQLADGARRMTDSFNHSDIWGQGTFLRDLKSPFVGSFPPGNNRVFGDFELHNPANYRYNLSRRRDRDGSQT